jgi:hypothetical protein
MEKQAEPVQLDTFVKASEAFYQFKHAKKTKYPRCFSATEQLYNVNEYV